MFFSFTPLKTYSRTVINYLIDMLTFNNFTTTVSFSDFSAENWDALVKDGISTKHMPWDETEIQML